MNPVDRINTATLGPSEVRRGLAESITERNATIYKYNTKHVPLKRAPRSKPTSKEEPLADGTTACEGTEPAEKEESEDAEDQTEAAEVEEESSKERVPTPEPYNPYVDFEVSDVDLPLVARLLRNVEPNLLWTWTRDSISFKHLSREQVVNRFPNTPFTTKVRRAPTCLLTSLPLYILFLAYFLSLYFYSSYFLFVFLTVLVSHHYTRSLCSSRFRHE